MLTTFFEFGIDVMRFASFLAQQVSADWSFTWSIPFVYTGIPVQDETSYYFPQGITGFPYHLFGGYGVVPKDLVTDMSPLWSIDYTATTNFLSLSIMVIGSVFLAVVVFNIVKGVVK